MAISEVDFNALIWHVVTILLDQKHVQHGPTATVMNVAAAVRDYHYVNQRDMEMATRALIRQASNIPTTPLKILALGDSITTGDTSADATGYRGYLAELLDRQNVSAIIDSTGAVDGIALSGLAPLVPPILAANPDAKIALLMVGTNDCNANDLANWQTRYAALIDQILTTLPSIKVVCARIVITDTTAFQYSPGLINAEHTLNTWVDNVVQARVLSGRVAKANMDSIPPQWLTDGGWHPGDAAYLMMAKLWADEISEWL